MKRSNKNNSQDEPIVPPENVDFYDKGNALSLDKDIERLLRDIDNLLGMRQRDLLKPDSKKTRFSIIPAIRALSSYKAYRDQWFEQVLDVPCPEAVENGTLGLKELLENGCNIKEHYNKKNLLLILIRHFHDKIISLVEEKSLIFERVRLICRNENKIIENQREIVEKMSSIHENLCDTIERYDRILSTNDVINQFSSKKNSEKVKQTIKFTSDDLLSYANDRNQLYRHDRDLNFFFQRIKNLITTDVEALAEAVYNEKLNPPPYRNTLPKKQPQLNEFLHDFESLAAWFNIDVPIELEDGRAFAYHCDRLFNKQFFISSAKPPSSSIEQQNVQTLGDIFIKNQRRDFLKSQYSSFDGPPVKISKSTWLESTSQLFAAVEDEMLSSQRSGQRTEKIDFQIRYEHDIVATENHDNVKQHMLVSLKYLTEAELLFRKEIENDDFKKFESAAEPGSHLNSKMGLCIPKGESGNVIFSQKRQNIKEAGVSKSNNSLSNNTASNDPTQNLMHGISDFFAPHELLSFLQLRYLKTRELRLILLRQLNFFRSIEKRLILDAFSLPEDWTSIIDPIFFETGSPLYESKRLIRKRDLDPLHALDRHGSEVEGHEDIRSVRGRQLYILNEEGENIIYDVSYEDLNRTELQLLRLATSVINRSSSENEKKDTEFLDRTKARLFDPKVFTESSFCAPEVDRQQVLLDLMESEVNFNDRKIMLTNAWMEFYENTPWPFHKRRLIKHIMSIIKTTREINDNDSYPLLTAFYQCRLFESQELLIIEVLNHLISKQSADDATFNFHHNEASLIHLTDIIHGHAEIAELPQMAKIFLNELDHILSSYVTVSKSLLEFIIWKHFCACWLELKQAGFQMPPTPTPLLFREDFLTYPGCPKSILNEILESKNSEWDQNLTTQKSSEVGQVPTKLIDDEQKIEILTLFLECLKSYRMLKENWLQTHFLEARLFEQAKVLGVSIKVILPPFSGNLFDDSEDKKIKIPTSLNAFGSGDKEDDDDDDDDDEAFLGIRERKFEDNEIGTTPLAIHEINEEWGYLSLESKITVLNFIRNGTLPLQDTLKFQAIEMLSYSVICETNFLIYNKLDLIFKPNTYSPIYSGDYASVAFLMGNFKKQIRRQLTPIYWNEKKKIQTNRTGEIITESDFYQCKSKCFSYYFSKWSEILQENCARILVIKQSRNISSAILTKNSGKPSILYFKTEGENTADPSSHDSVVDMDAGAGLRVWTAPTPQEILLLHRTSASNPPDHKVSSTLVFAKLLQVYSMTEKIRNLSKLIGELQMDRGNDLQRQAISTIKKEILNFGFPISLDRLIHYLCLRWTVLSLQLRCGILGGSFFLLTSTNISSNVESFNLTQSYYKRLVAIISPKPHKYYFSLNPLHKKESYYMSSLTLRERKIFSERFTEIESSLEELYHRLNLESVDVVDALNSQINFLISTIQLYHYRFELLSVLAKRHPIKHAHVDIFLNFYKTNVHLPAHKEFIAIQHQKGSHIEDITLSKSAQFEFEKCQIGVLKAVLNAFYSSCIIKGLRNVFDILVDERTEALFNQHDSIYIPRPYLTQNYPLILNEADVLQKFSIFQDFMAEITQNTIKQTAQHSNSSTDDKNHQNDVDQSLYLIKREALSQAVLLSNVSFISLLCSKNSLLHKISKNKKLSAWNQIKLREIDEFYTELQSITSNLISRQSSIIDSYRFEKEMILKEYERDVRLGASVKASEIYVELATLGSELSELKKSKKLEERVISQRLRQEYEDLVTELSSQIHKLKARFNEFRINSVDVALRLLSKVKREDLLSFIQKDYSEYSNKMGRTILDLQEIIDELRSDNNELKQVLSKLKSMYALKERTSKMAVNKKIANLIEEKRSAEERLWDSFRENEVREKALRKTLIKCQKDLVSLETQNEMLKKELKDEQKARQSLQKSSISKEQSAEPNLELTSIRKVEKFSRFEFEKLIIENKQSQFEIVILKKELARLQNIIQAQEWRQATRQRLRTQSATSYLDPSTNILEEVSLNKLPSNVANNRPLTAKKEIIIVPAIKVPSRPNSVAIKSRSSSRDLLHKPITR